MSEMDVIRQIAERTMMISVPAGSNHAWLWDRTLRILRNVETICQMTELTSKDFPIDRFCLTAAACFAETGFSRCESREKKAAPLVLSDINLAELRDYSAQAAAVGLGTILAKPKVEKCCKIILESANRFTEMVEAAILSDARNLDDMGVVGLCHEFRRAAIQGRGVSDILDSWKRKIDYRYWQARLREGFHFESVRQLAEKRFNTAAWFMNRLADEHHNIPDAEPSETNVSYPHQPELTTVHPK